MTIVGEKRKVNENVDKQKLTCKERCIKWDRQIASIFGLLVFFSLVGIVIYQVLIHEADQIPKEEEEEEVVTAFQVLSSRDSNPCSLNKCDIKCSIIEQANGSLIANFINEKLGNSPECSYIELLTLSQVQFQNKILTKGWLNGTEAGVKQLKLVGCKLDSINQAFSGPPFKSLAYLVLDNCGLETLNKSTFHDLRSLTRFEFNNNDKTPLSVEEGVLDGMPNVVSFQYIHVIDKDNNLLSNSFGCAGTLLSGLFALVLMNNDLQKIDDCSFTNVPKVKTLRLDDSKLRTIHKDSFKNIPKFTELTLMRNELTTLHNGTFSYSTFSNISLGENKWMCNCSLQWLKDLYLNNETNYINKGNPPKCNDSHEFAEVEFCPTSTETPTPEISSPSSVGPEPPYVTINCITHSAEKTLLEVQTTVMHKAIVKLKEEFVSLEFHELDLPEDTLKVKVIITTNVKLDLYHLVWFNSNNKSECGCDSPLQDGLILERLNRNTTYAFSVLENEKSEVSPKSTFGIQTEPFWADKAWIVNKYQMMVISVSVVGGLLIVLLTVLSTFLCIRRYPDVISGNKNVIIVKSSKKPNEEVNFPKEYEKPPYWDPYLIPGSQGYLTPKLHRYDKVRHRPPLMRSMSDWSIGNSSSAYIDPRQPYDLKLLRSRMMQDDDITPPLPPPNKTFKERPEPIDEDELYSSV